MRKKIQFSRRFAIFFYIAILIVLRHKNIVSQETGIQGLWERQDRFIEIKDDSLRIILKPYYGFVWEDSATIPCLISQIVPQEYRVEMFYPGEKTPQLCMLAKYNNMLFLDYLYQYEKNTSENRVPSTATANPKGFYISHPTSTSILMYPEKKREEIFAYYFLEDYYIRIRYWEIDALIKDTMAEININEEKIIHIPKIIKFDENIFTCITSSGNLVRNYEKGTYKIQENSIAFNPENTVYPTNQNIQKDSIPFYISDDGRLIAFGEPYLKFAIISNIDTEMKIHNDKRRPLRKPQIEYMDLDFRWEEIEKIRGNLSVQ